MPDHETQDTTFERPTVTTREVNLSDIAPWDTGGARSVVDKSMTALGGQLVDPVLQELPETSEYRYRVLDGARRLQHHLDGGQPTTITAKVVPAELGDATAQAITVATNLNRATNPLKEALALKALVDDHGYDRQALSALLGISINVVEKRLRLVEAPAELLQGVAQGHIAPGTAQRIANLNAGEQDQLVARYRKTGRLRGADVAEVMRASRQSFLSNANAAGLFGDAPTIDDLDGEDLDWFERHVLLAREQGYALQDMLAVVYEAYEADGEVRE